MSVLYCTLPKTKKKLHFGNKFTFSEDLLNAVTLCQANDDDHDDDDNDDNDDIDNKMISLSCSPTI